MKYVRYKNEQAFIIPALIGLIIGFSFIVGTAATIINYTLGSSLRNQGNQSALNLAEAGINYYLWHMSHNNTDYLDGNSSASLDPNYGYGPFKHDYRDASGTVIGSFTLYIKAGLNGSKVITVRSIGEETKAPGVKRTLQAKIGAPSFSTYAVASNSELWFGNTEIADGPVHSNVGVKMDGPNNSDVTSANTTYVPSSSSGSGSGVTRPGVWCDPAITSPNCSTRSKVSWRYPVPSIDFNKLTADLCQFKKDAINNQGSTACNTKPTRTNSYIPPRNTAFDDSIGYLITLNNNGTYTLSNVNNEVDTQSNYTSALSTNNTIANITIPSNGVIFVEDNVWVRTESSGFNGRITIASARLAVTGATIATIADNILYENKYDGSDSIGIIAEDNIDVAPYVPSPLEINAGLIAQTGRVQFRPTYNSSGGYTPGYVNPAQTLTFFGSIASNEQWTWSWVRCGTNSTACWSGFEYNTTKYDENLRYNPPPNFPVTSTFDILEWREVVTDP